MIKIIINPVIRWLIPWSGRAHYLSKRDRNSRFRSIYNDLEEEVIEADGWLEEDGLFTSKKEVLRQPRDDFSCSPFEQYFAG